MAERQWNTKFFIDDPLPLTLPPGNVLVTNWPGKGRVLWARGRTPNALNPRLNPVELDQPEVIPDGEGIDATDRQIGWRLYVPSAILAKDVVTEEKPAPPIPTTLLLARAAEETAYGLRFFFERAGTGALFCLAGREGGDRGGRWNVGLTQGALEDIFRSVGLHGTPEVQVLAGYSTGFGIVQSINNGLLPLVPVKRLVFFDCLYRTDRPGLPKEAAPPMLLPGDRPEFTSSPDGTVVRDELHAQFQSRPFNTRRAIATLLAASPKCVVAGYSATTGGAPRYAIFDRLVDAQNREKLRLRQMGTRPVVELPVLAELRDQQQGRSGWSVSSAFDMVALARLLDLGVRATLVSTDEMNRVPTFRDAIANGFPGQRGLVLSSVAVRQVMQGPQEVLDRAIGLLDWVSGVAARPTTAEWIIAKRLARDHRLTLPGWDYGDDDLDEFRHAATLSEFGWELLPP